MTIEPKLEAFVQSGMSFTVGKVDRMFFVCRAFAHKVIGSVGRVDLLCDIWIPKIFGPPGPNITEICRPFEILGPPPLPYCNCISRCEGVGYKRSITAMDQTSTVFA